MRVLIVSQYFWPEQFRINELVEFLKTKNLEVEILTGLPNYPDGSLFSNYKKDPNKFNSFCGSKIYRLPIILRKDSSKINLFLNYISFILSGIFIAPFILRKKKYDIIFTFATSPITVAIVSIFLAKIKNCKSVLWVLDLWPDILFELKIIKNTYLISLLDDIIKKIYEKTDIILVQSKTFKSIIDKKINNNKSIYFPSWPENLKHNIKIKIKKKVGKINIVFTGNIGEAQNFDNVFKVIKYFRKNKKLNWIIVGSGRKLNIFRRNTIKYKIKNIEFYGNQPIQNISAFHSIADILLISLKKGKALSATIPGKLQTYLNSNKYILGMIDGEAKDLINESKAGKCVKPDDVKGMINLINKILSNKNLTLFKRSKINTKLFVNKNFNKVNLLKKLINIFENIIFKTKKIKLITNVRKLPFTKSFCLSGLNLAFLGYYNSNQVKLYENLYHWPDGIFSKKFYNSNKIFNKIPGRKLISNLVLPSKINKIYVFGNLSNNSYMYLKTRFKIKIIHIDLPYANVKYLYNNYCKKKFTLNDLIILTLPTPKQEQFAELISANNNYYKVLCVGGAISMASGDEKPIPEFWDNLGLEFAWRLRTDTYRRVVRLIQSFISYLHGEFYNKYSKIDIKIIK